MEWERKFSSIVQETESNLAKVKQRLGSAHASSITALTGNGYSLPDRSGIFSSSNNSFAKSFPPPGGYNSSLNLMTSPTKFLSATGSPTYQGAIASQYRSPERPHTLDQSPGVFALLSDKLDAQTRTMDQLTRTVRQMEDEKGQYQKQIRELRNELSLLTTRVSEKGVDMDTERKIDMWRGDMLAEMQLMQSQIQLHRTDDMGNMSTSILRDISDTKRQVTDQCDSIRRDVSSLKSRLVKLEVSVANIMSSNSDFARRSNRTDKTLQDLAESHNNTMRDMSRTITDCTQDKAEINRLKTSLRTITHTLDNVKDKIQGSGDRHKTKTKHLKTARKKVEKSEPIPSDLLSCATTDLDDLTDTTDFLDIQTSDFSLSSKQQNSVKDFESQSEDELDPDLTTYDLISSYSCLDTDDLK